jgi:hypothetical protein
MGSFSIPWKCLDFDTIPPKTTINQPKPSKTFAQALSNICDIPESQFPQAVLKGDELAIQIPEFEYEAGMADCKHNLHGRVIWPKGSSPLTAAALKAKLSMIWKDFSKWGITSIGRGFFEFSFTSLEDVRRVRSHASWNLNPGMLKLFAWSKDFNPRYQHNTSAQVWVKIYGLSQEYWRKNILFSIVSGIGSPICTDSVTAKPLIERTFGHYARVLVEIDLTQALRYKILVERKGYAFYVDLEYENVPEYCTYCRTIGHHVDFCKKCYPEPEKEQRKHTKEPKKIFVQVRDGRVEQNITKENPNVEKETTNFEENNEEDIRSNEKEATTVLIDKGKAIAVDSSPADLLKDQDIALEAELIVALQAKPSRYQELNNIDSDSSQGSFVDATQFKSNSDQSEDEEDNAVPTPERVQKDMAFLSASWANMAENVAEEDRLYETSENNRQIVTQQQVDADGFQLQVSKSKKKTQRKLTQSSKKPYSTRSKVSPKPLK